MKNTKPKENASPKNKEDVSFTTVCSKQHDGTAVRELLTRIGDKWSILLIVILSQAPEGRSRFSELQRKLQGISQRMLTSTLRNLQRDGMVTRQLFPEIPPRVEYQLTPLGHSLLEPMQGLVDWATCNWDQVRKSREKFDIGT